MLLGLLLAVSCLGASARAETDPVEGFGLYRYRGAGWDWGGAPLATGFTATEEAADGTCTVTFEIAVSRLPGLDPARARFGVSSGVTAGGATVWATAAESFAVSPSEPPLAAPTFGQAALLGVRLTCDRGLLRAEVSLDAPPELESAWDLMGLIDADGDETTGYRGAEWLIQDVSLGSGPVGGLSVPWLVVRSGIVLAGSTAEIVAWVSNDSATDATDVRVRLELPPGASANEALDAGPYALPAAGSRKHVWTVRFPETGTQRVRLEVTSAAERAQKTRWLTVVRRRDPQREFETASGDWRLFPPRRSLQEANPGPVRRIEPLPPRRLESNLMGITTHLPRSVNDEDPFRAAHAVDGDPATCWASRWWRIATPLEPQWLSVDLGRVATLDAVRFLPAWRNSGAPVSFVIETSVDGAAWSPAVERVGYTLEAQPEGDLVEDGRSWQCFEIAPRRARYVRLTATRLTQGATSFFCAPFEPFQLRIAELGAVDGRGAYVRPVSATSSTVHNAWYNSPEQVTATWPLLLSCGPKLNRIGQWGDRTDWPAVEQEKGVYRIPAEVDRAIAESHRAGVETLLTLAYGNNLYQQVPAMPDFGPTWHRGHPFLQCAPTTDEAVEGFARYCAFMARHFRGTVRYYEIWNEENGWFYDDWSRVPAASQVRAYGRVLKAAAQAIKQANPEAVVVFGGTAGSTLDYPRIALEEGAGPWIDVFAFHPYGHPTPEGVPDNFLTLAGETMEWTPRPASIRTYEEEIAAMRELLHRYNPRMQVWADEMNWFAPGEPARTDMGDLSELAQAKHLARFYALNAWLGCGAVWWSMYNANGIQEWAVLRSVDGSPRPAWYAAQYTATVLDDVTAAEDVAVEVVGPAPPDLLVKPYRNGRGETLVGLWCTTPARDACAPGAVSLRVAGVEVHEAELLDLLYGSSQDARLTRDGGSTVLRGLLVGDWPLVVRLR